MRASVPSPCVGPLPVKNARSPCAKSSCRTTCTLQPAPGRQGTSRMRAPPKPANRTPVLARRCPSVRCWPFAGREHPRPLLYVQPPNTARARVARHVLCGSHIGPNARQTSASAPLPCVGASPVENARGPRSNSLSLCLPSDPPATAAAVDMPGVRSRLLPLKLLSAAASGESAPAAGQALAAGLGVPGLPKSSRRPVRGM
jgi:hypothetical protein